MPLIPFLYLIRKRNFVTSYLLSINMLLWRVCVKLTGQMYLIRVDLVQRIQKYQNETWNCGLVCWPQHSRVRAFFETCRSRFWNKISVFAFSRRLREVAVVIVFILSFKTTISCAYDWQLAERVVWAWKAFESQVAWRRCMTILVLRCFIFTQTFRLRFVLRLASKAWRVLCNNGARSFVHVLLHSCMPPLPPGHKRGVDSLPGSLAF